MSDPRFRPFVPPNMKMKEFTFRRSLLGLVMSVILGAANAYLGLRAGMTIAATYPAAVIGMAVLRLMKGSILEENIARTAGSIGESVAAGAIFTIPAFVIAGLWPGFDRGQVLEIRRADGRRRHAGRAVRFADAARDGGRSGTSLPGIGGGVGDPQSGTAGREGGEVSFRQHGVRRPDLSPGRDQPVQARERLRVNIGDVGRRLLLAHEHEPECRHHNHWRRQRVCRCRT